MRAMFAFVKKELLEQLRSGRLMILGVLFVLLGIMNPAVAKLTPWLLEMMADSLAESGMTVTSVTVSALDSWVQFFKNAPMGLAVFILLESSVFTREYQSGTLVLALTKGINRYKVVISKAGVLTVLWTAGYWLCFGINYGYNAYYWDNSAAQNLMFSAVLWWLFGLWVIALMILFSTVADFNTGVLCGVGFVVLAAFLAGLLPKCSKYSPAFLTDGKSLLCGLAEAGGYMPSVITAIAVSVACLVISVPIFNKKYL